MTPRRPWLLTVLFLTPTVALTAAEVSVGELRSLSDRLMDETQRQHQVKRRMDVAITAFRDIVVDLRSNELLDAHTADRLLFAAKVVGKCSVQHVPAAARHLEAARKQILAMRPLLEAAGVEIDIIIRELERLLARATSTQAIDDIRRELRELIEKEEKVQEKTQQWGKELYQQPQKAEEQRKELTEKQQRLAQRAEATMEKLQRVQDAEKDPLKQFRMKRASEVLQKEEVDRRLERAAQHIDHKQPIAAFQEQEKALQALRQAERMLQPDDQATGLERHKDAREKLQEILQKQQDLRQKVEAANPQHFDERKHDMEAQQRQLERDVGDVARDIPRPQNAQQALGDPRKELAKAQDHMQQAQRQMQQGDAEATAKQQVHAEQAIQKAIDQLDAQMAAAPDAAQQPLADQLAQMQHDQQALHDQTQQQAQQGQSVQNLQPPQQQLATQAQQMAQQAQHQPLQQAMQQAQQAMDQAAQQLQQNQAQPAQQAQQQALEALAQAQQQAQQMAAQQAQLQQALEELAQAQQQAQALAQQQRDLRQATQQAAQQAVPALQPQQQELGQQAQQMAQDAPEAGDAGEHMAQATEAMDQAGEAMHGAQQAEAEGQQMAAIAALEQAGEAFQKAYQQMAQAAQAQQALAMAHQPGQQPSQTPTQQQSTQPSTETSDHERSPGSPKEARGQHRDRKDARWTPLGDRERDSLFQDYARELPIEYRDLLQDYYEALSKQR